MAFENISVRSRLPSGTISNQIGKSVAESPVDIKLRINNFSGLNLEERFVQDKVDIDSKFLPINCYKSGLGIPDTFFINSSLHSNESRFLCPEIIKSKNKNSGLEYLNPDRLVKEAKQDCQNEQMLSHIAITKISNAASLMAASLIAIFSPSLPSEQFSIQKDFPKYINHRVPCIESKTISESSIFGFAGVAINDTATVESENLLEIEGNFNKQVISILKSEYVEDGMFHPAEDVFLSSIEKYPMDTPRWIQGIYEANYLIQPLVAGELLKIAGRLPSEYINNADSENIFTHLFSRGLEHIEVEVRDSAVYALECWGSEKARNILTQHLNRETDSRLIKYIGQVVIDLSD